MRWLDGITDSMDVSLSAQTVGWRLLSLSLFLHENLLSLCFVLFPRPTGFSLDPLGEGAQVLVFLSPLSLSLAQLNYTPSMSAAFIRVASKVLGAVGHLPPPPTNSSLLHPHFIP